MLGSRRERMVLKHEVLQVLRGAAERHDFIEVNTPAIRGATSVLAPRRQVIVDEPHASASEAFLKTSHDTALRTLLRYTPRVFEIGACFRMDPPDGTHFPEFLLAEFAASGVSLEFFISLVQEVVNAILGGSSDLERISVRERMQADLQVDPAIVSSDHLRDAVLARAPELSDRLRDVPAFYAVNDYITERVEPKTGFALLFDYPLCTVSKAKQVGSTQLVERFEVFINGLEVANSYMYERDPEAFIRRSKENNHYNDEAVVTAEMMRQDEWPQESGIVGFGVERLCCALAEATISEFVFASEFGFTGLEAG